jgi:MFS transporter, MCT family, solute carrier family 16 (monocarboxylic acid transporters), member 10
LDILFAFFKLTHERPVLTFIDAAAAKASIAPPSTLSFVAISNTSAAFGRVIMGMLSNRLGEVYWLVVYSEAEGTYWLSSGCMTIIIPCTIVAACVTYAWPFAKDLPSLLVVAIVYGWVFIHTGAICYNGLSYSSRSYYRFSSGSYAGLISIPLIHMGETADVGRRTGGLLSALSIAALIGPPISGALSTEPGGYMPVGYYAGLYHALHNYNS